MSWSGVYADGISPRLQQLDVEADFDGLQLRGEATREHWRWSDILAVVPLASGEPVRLGHRASAARLRIDDPTAAVALLAHAPSLQRAHRVRSVGRRFSKGIWIRFGLATAALVFVIAIGPDMIAGLMPQSWAARIGDETLRVLAPESKRCTDEAALRVARDLAARLAPTQTIRLEIASLGQPNAVALPGGRIMLSREMVAFARTPQEIAFVLAHELAHEQHNDPLTGFVRVSGMQVLSRVMTGGSGMLGNAGVVAANAPMSRRVEARADSDGMRMLEAANIRHNEIDSFWRRMEAQTGASNGYLASHPSTAARARAATTDSQDGEPPLDAAAWDALKKGCR
ncbi:M48 family metallopeptidase [Roseiterribacter gracilis]|uniref:Peptidase M48 domain-containing protein n=1 Tax=Roseiterribacter gracilis TaxID=2812848 RepID=A0A8S8XD48_9PROT|nr:hypothetical protein TMPK1_14340 [Rhodospirillales bacterium TMPK1]